MRVLALLSGGKDSVAAIEVAQGHGWDVVAALAVHPAEDDAWMFHTPNLAVVRGVAQCLGIPLLEAKVRAGAVAEVEDLGHAIAQAARHLRLDGIVSGALASEYQRTRLDAIGHRLGLRTFAPLWHKEPAAYVRGLLAAGYELRFSRCAAEGVPASWAGQRLDEAKVAAMLAHKARPHVAGEGGEYETLVVDAPHFRRHLAVDASEVETSSSRSTWRITAWHVQAR